MKIFCDLDGVLADFDKRCKEVTQHLPKDIVDSQMWPLLEKDNSFFEYLDWMSEAYTLWNHIKPHKPSILTGCPRGNWAPPQKRAWCGRELGWDVPVITCWSKEKHLHGKVDDILIDDRKKARTAWEDMGGIFILYENPSDVIMELQKLGISTDV